METYRDQGAEANSSKAKGPPEGFKEIDFEKTDDRLLQKEYKRGHMSDDEDSESSDSNRVTNINRNVKTTENETYSCWERIFIALSYLLVILFFPLSMFVCLVVLQEYQRAVVLRLGRLRPGGAKGPGLMFIVPCVDEYQKVDLRTTSLDVPPQDILTKDSVTVSVDAVVYYRINNPLDVVLQVIDPAYCCRLLAMTTLRNVTGLYMLIELVSAKKALSRQIKSMLDSTGATDPWGIRIERVEITDILMPESLQRAMAVEQEARREAMAKVAAANGERDAVKALKEAADIMESNPIALQLRYLQTLNTICNDQTEAIVFPLPIDILAKLMK
ncbi:band 7 protein AGAP004871 [Drosophila innubila]|uniref:band 7 protein AGAP004871 n=1 Tax=Drosophila innubila TaxID=198719 RepID=UPI00148BEE87|nr:band 7 protein AGAP004871 [Drosophila innubila]